MANDMQRAIRSRVDVIFLNIAENRLMANFPKEPLRTCSRSDSSAESVEYIDA